MRGRAAALVAAGAVQEDDQLPPRRHPGVEKGPLLPERLDGPAIRLGGRKLGLEKAGTSFGRRRIASGHDQQDKRHQAKHGFQPFHSHRDWWPYSSTPSPTAIEAPRPIG